MRKTQRFFSVATLGLAYLLSCCATASPISAPTESARVTVLYDAFGKDAAMTKDWGYAALVEINGKRILFDTGGDPTIFANNVKARGVDLTKLDFAVISHRHGDHVGGLSYLLSVNPNVKIYAPKDGLGGIFGSDIPSKFYRRDEALPAEKRYFGGTPPETMKLGTVFPGANIQLIDKTTELVPGITLIALVSDVPGTKEMKELSLAINTPDGLLLVVGCSHPGIESIVAEAAKINPHIHFIAGGFHLVAAQDSVIEKIAATLHDTYKVDYIAPGHCTGEPTFAALQKTFGDHYIYAGLGSTLNLGAKPRAARERRASGVLDDGDLRAYRSLLAYGDDVIDGRPGSMPFAQTKLYRDLGSGPGELAAGALWRIVDISIADVVTGLLWVNLAHPASVAKWNYRIWAAGGFGAGKLAAVGQARPRAAKREFEMTAAKRSSIVSARLR